MKDRREEVYDSEISPLVWRIIEIAKREQIPMIMSFGMRDESGTPMTSDTALQFGTKGNDFLSAIENRYALAMGVVRGHPGFDTAKSLRIVSHHEPSDVQGGLDSMQAEDAVMTLLMRMIGKDK